MSSYTDFRDKYPALSHGRYSNGDLYGMSFLKEYKEPMRYHLHIRNTVQQRSVRLFVFCDSYVDDRIKKNNFDAVDSIKFLRYWNPSTFVHFTHLDSTKRNIVVIEMSERHVRILGKTGASQLFWMLDKDTIDTKTQTATATEEPMTWWQAFQKNTFNPNINSNLELNLFEYALFNPIKELKAKFNYKYFNRINENVYVDEAHKHLYYTPTLSTTEDQGAFKPLADDEIASIVTMLNTVYRRYKQVGFEEVYFSIIPNPVSCINPSMKTYNNLITRIYATDSLVLPIIDVFKPFKQNPKLFYHRSDTHWNNEGLQHWTDMLNARINTNNCIKN